MHKTLGEESNELGRPYLQTVRSNTGEEKYTVSLTIRLFMLYFDPSKASGISRYIGTSRRCSDHHSHTMISPAYRNVAFYGLGRLAGCDFVAGTQFVYFRANRAAPANINSPSTTSSNISDHASSVFI
jgi:hypothetical protein